MRRWRRAASAVAVVGVGLVLLFAGACKRTDNEAPVPPPASSSAASAASEQAIRLSVVALNDFHGALQPGSLRGRSANGEKVRRPVGGAAWLGGYLRTLRQVNPGGVLVLDAGDHIQGSLEADASEGASVVALFNFLGIDAATVGNHEFDHGVVGQGSYQGVPGQDRQAALKQRLAQANYPYVSANILDAATGKMVEWPNLAPWVVIERQGVKVGLLGLITEETPVVVHPRLVGNLRFEPLHVAAKRELPRLRAAGAEVVVLLAHAGGECSDISNPHDTTSCNPPAEVFRLAEALPKGGVDLIVAGHSHEMVAHFVNDIPIVETTGYGRYLSMVDLFVDPATRRVLRDRTIIHRPMPLCHVIEGGQGPCTDPSIRNLDEQRPPRVGVHPVTPQPEAVAVVQPYLDQVEQLKSKVIAEAVTPITGDHQQESELGNLVTDAMRTAVPSAKVALMNAGGIRRPIPLGPITYGAVYNAFPFPNYLVEVTLSGALLTRLIEIGTSGSKPVTQVSGLRVTYRATVDPAFDRDLNGDGKQEHWERDRLVSVTLADGSPLVAEQNYRVLVNDFLAFGGDDYGYVMRQLSADRLVHHVDVSLRDAVVARLKKIGQVDGPDNPLLDPQNPRIILVDGDQGSPDGASE